MNRKQTLSESRRLQKTLKESRRGDSAKSSNVISVPPKLAVATDRSSKDGLVRRKKAMKDFLRSPTSSSRRKSKSDQTAASDEDRNKVMSEAKAAKSLREKQIEDRVSELGKALSTAYEEQKKLLEELEDLRTDESSTRLLSGDTTNSPANPQTPEPNNDDTDDSGSDGESDRQAWLREKAQMEEQIYVLEERVHDLRNEMAEIDHAWKSRWEQAMNQTAHERNHYAEEVHRSQKEAAERQRQLIELKQSISSLTRLENHIADEELAERMDNLYYKTRDWVVSSLRRSQLVDISQLPDHIATQLPYSVRVSGPINKSQRLYLFHSVVASSLIRIFEDSIYFGLPRHGIFSSLRDCAEITPHDTSEFARWRSLSLTIALKQAGDDISSATETNINSLVSSTVSLLRELSTPSMPEGSSTGLRAIFHQAAMLSKDFNLQITPYRIFLPQSSSDAGIPFDSFCMDIANIEELDEIDAQSVLFALSPCIEKIAPNNKLGEGQPLIINKAKVITSEFM